MDISSEVIDLALKKFWRGNDKSSFQVGDIVRTPYLKAFRDDTFDLILTRWLLVHIPTSEEKTQMIQELVRVSKALIILEPVDIALQGTVQYFHSDEYCLSWDNWNDYGLTRFDPTGVVLEGNTKVFYSVKE